MDHADLFCKTKASMIRQLFPLSGLSRVDRDREKAAQKAARVAKDSNLGSDFLYLKVCTIQMVRRQDQAGV